MYSLQIKSVTFLFTKVINYHFSQKAIRKKKTYRNCKVIIIIFKSLKYKNKSYNLVIQKH